MLLDASRLSIYYGYTLFLLLGCLRGFTIIPVTSLIILGLLFFDTLPLFILTIAGIIVSAASVYYFSELLHLDEFFEQKHSRRIAKIKSVLQKNELPIIIGWSAFPFLPTDLISYVCGTLRVNFAKFILGILIGEGVTSATYIFFGHYLTALWTNYNILI
ncbi:MAG: VTT domain-containing protein [bacterium]|nr:VTT domain-containing protein [bacterium]